MARRLVCAWLVVSTLATLAGCNAKIPDSPSTYVPLDIDVTRPECENVNPLHCLYPWPSSRFEARDPTTRTGRRLALPEEAMPANKWGSITTAAPYNQLDGFSPMTSMLTVVDGAFDTSVLPDELHIGASLEPASPTVLVDAETGERVAHFAEIDSWSDTDPSRAPLYIRPAARLREGHHYVVAIRGLTRLDGAPVEPSAYFLALRDRILTRVDELEGRRPVFEDIFGVLEAAGVERSSLIEAWDFYTASGEVSWGPLLHARDDALTRVGPQGIGCTVTSVEEPTEHPGLFRLVRGTVTTPLYLDAAGPTGRLVRDATGNPVFQRMTEVPFVLGIPTSVRDAAASTELGSPLWVVGHGLFQSAEETVPPVAQMDGNRYGFVAVGTDWSGLSGADLLHLAEVLGDMGRFPEVTEGLAQSVINTLVLTRSFAGVCADLPELEVPSATGRRQIGTIDPSRRYYTGWSLGAIVGLSFAALSTDIDRFALVVGGMSFPIMVPRSIAFPDNNLILTAFYPEKLDRALLIVMTASMWDMAEPSTFAPHVLRDPLAGTTTKHILYQIGHYDAWVANAASAVAIRTLGMPQLGPAAFEMWNVPAVAGPVDSAAITFDTGAPALPVGTIAPMQDNNVHYDVQVTESALQQIETFLTEGRIESFCEGPCDPG